MANCGFRESILTIKKQNKGISKGIRKAKEEKENILKKGIEVNKLKVRVIRNMGMRAVVNLLL